jgi:hypothetical protein
MVTVSPRIGALLTQVAETPDIETALWRVLSDYIDLKFAALTVQVKEFEAKWGMSFSEFSSKIKDGTLGADAYSFDVEKEFWEWEKAETLLNHYQTLKAQSVS